MDTKQKYLHVKIEGQSEVAVIDLGKIKGYAVPHHEYKRIIEPKLVKALEEHFDCEVKIVNMTTMRSEVPLDIEYYVLICAEDGDYYQTVFLEETWVY